MFDNLLDPDRLKYYYEFVKIDPKDPNALKKAHKLALKYGRKLPENMTEQHLIKMQKDVRLALKLAKLALNEKPPRRER